MTTPPTPHYRALYSDAIAAAGCGHYTPYWSFIPLNSAFTAKSAGACAGIAFVAPSSSPIETVGFHVGGYYGTWTSTDEQVQIGLYRATANRNLGTVLANGTANVTLSAADANSVKLHTFATAPVPVKGGHYVLTIGDSDGNSTHFVNVGRYARSGNYLIPGHMGSYGTTGNPNVTTSTYGSPAFVVRQADGVTFGSPFVSSSYTTAAGTYAIRLTLEHSVRVVGFNWGVNLGPLNAGGTVTVFDGAPNTTPVHTWTYAGTGETSNVVKSSYSVFPESDHVELDAGTYYFAITVPSAFVYRLDIAPAGNATLRSLRPFAAASAVSTGTAWTVDEDAMPQFGPLFQPIDGGGGGSTMLVHTGAVTHGN